MDQLNILSAAKLKLDVAQKVHQDICDERSNTLAEIQLLNAKLVELNTNLSASFDVLHEAEDNYTSAAIDFANYMVKS